jgi:hypothetical protein
MMNERIRELAKQAKMFATPMKFHLGGQDYARVRDEKFAELIVRECAEQIIAKGTDWVDFAPSQTGVRPEYWDMAQQIKEHFGVEE